MNATIEGKALLLGDDIDTDTIIPTFALQKSKDPKTFAEYAFFYAIPHFKERGRNIIVAGRNFGCGSSREEAVFALVHADVHAVLATSFAPIFKRNAFNNALLCIQINTSQISDNDYLEIDLHKRKVFNRTKNETYEFVISSAEETLILEGGLLNLLMKRLRDK